MFCRPERCESHLVTYINRELPSFHNFNFHHADRSLRQCPDIPSLVRQVPAAQLPVSASVGLSKCSVVVVAIAVKSLFFKPTRTGIGRLALAVCFGGNHQSNFRQRMASIFYHRPAARWTRSPDSGRNPLNCFTSSGAGDVKDETVGF